MGHLIEAASSGRSRCRACRDKIDRGALRLGQKAPNPFGEGNATYWFHLKCAAAKVPQVFLAALDEAPDTQAEAEGLRGLAVLASQHRRRSRLGSITPAPTGRARCRHCRELIGKGTLRFALEVVEEGMLESWGFIHVRCARDYCEGDVVPLLEARGESMSDELRRELNAP